MSCYTKSKNGAPQLGGEHR